MATYYNEKKKSRRAFSFSMLLTLTCAFICAVCFCSTTFSWFTAGKTSSKNTVTAGYFAVEEITLTDANNQPISFTKKEGDTWTVTLNAGTYVVRIYATDTSTVRGHCVVEIGDKVQRTAPIIGENCLNRDAGEQTTYPFTFQITVDANNTAVSFTVKWGMSAEDDLIQHVPSLNN